MMLDVTFRAALDDMKTVVSLNTLITIRVKTLKLVEDKLKTSWKTKNCYAEDVFKTS